MSIKKINVKSCKKCSFKLSIQEKGTQTRRGRNGGDKKTQRSQQPKKRTKIKNTDFKVTEELTLSKFLKK